MEDGTLNIDKTQMELAYANRSNPAQYRELIHYFEQMSEHFVKKFGIKSNVRDEIKQEALIVAVKAIDKYDPSKKSTPFSYFYKVFHTAFLYHLRKMKNKSDKRVQTCSLDAFDNIHGEESFRYVEDDEHYVEFDGDVFDKQDLQNKIKEAKSIGMKMMKTKSALSRQKLIQDSDPVVKKIAKQYYDNKMSRRK